MRFKPRTFREHLARARAWLSILILAPLAAAAIFTRPYLPFEGLPEFGVEMVAWLLFFAGAALRWWATLYIGGRKDLELVTQGPYSICRNPLYLGTFLMTLSVGVFLQSASLIAGILVVGAGYLLITVPVEERRLAEIYGTAFEEYRRRVPCFVPKFSLFVSPPELNIRLNGINAEFKRTLQYVTIPLICYLIEHLRMLPTWPTPIVLP